MGGGSRIFKNFKKKKKKFIKLIYFFLYFSRAYTQSIIYNTMPSTNSVHKIDLEIKEEVKSINPVASMNSKTENNNSHKIDLNSHEKVKSILPVTDMNTTIPVITAPNTDTSNNNIRVESPDLIDGDMCVPYTVVIMIFGYVTTLVNLPATFRTILTCMGKDETTIKKVLVLLSVMDRQPASWSSKDAELQALVVGVIFFIYKAKQSKVEEIMFGLCDMLMDEVESGKTTEGSYKNMIDSTMRLKQIIKELDEFNLGVEPRGSWINFQGDVMLKLSYY